MFLSQYDYNICYRKSALMGNADALSRLPLAVESNLHKEKFINAIEILGDLPIDASTIIKYQKSDQDLLTVRHCLKTEDWPKIMSKTVQCLKNRKTEVVIMDDCLMLGQRVIIPERLKENILEILHECHFGIVKIKSLSRGSVWWLNIDRDLETYIASCPTCQKCIGEKGKTEHGKWKETTYPFERVHIDFFHFQHKTFFIMIDTYSKWIEVKYMNKTRAIDVIEKLKSIYSIFGNPTELVSDS